MKQQERSRKQLQSSGKRLGMEPKRQKRLQTTLKIGENCDDVDWNRFVDFGADSAKRVPLGNYSSLGRSTLCYGIF